MIDLREEVARAIAKAKGYDPDEHWEEYDRNAAAAVTVMGDYPGWEADVFRREVRWGEFEVEADAAIAIVLERIKAPGHNVLMAGANAITADHMKAMANYDAACDCWQAMIAKLEKTTP